MEIERSIDMPWAFTYKKLGGDDDSVYESDYNIVRKELNNSGYVKHIKFEKDPKGRLHCHGIILLRKGFFRQKLKVQGFHCHLREVYDERDWLSYCNKNQGKQDEVLYLLDPIYEV